MHWLKNTVLNLITALGGILLGIILVEIVLRLFFPIPYSMEIEYIPDGHLGTRLQPNRVYRLKSGGTCTINNLGFRETTDLSFAKPNGVVRIVALGGSSTFCYQVDDTKTWVALLEQHLRERYGSHIQVINASVPGYSVFESKINYLYQIRPLDPDIVIVYHTWNDMKYFHVIESGNYPKKGVSSGNSPLKSFLRNFQLAWRVRNLLNEVIYPYYRENSFSAGANASTTTITPNGPAHRWEKQNYDDLAIWLKKDSVLPIFASQAGLLSSDNINDPDIRDVIYTEFVNLTFEDILEQWLAISKIIETSAKENNILFVDVYNQVTHNKQFFTDHVHLTEAGNAKVAEVLFNAMVANPQVESLLLTQTQVAVGSQTVHFHAFGRVDR